MRRAVTKANRALALGVAETGDVAQQPPNRGESAGDFLRALRETKAKIHVDLGPKIRASWITFRCYICFAHALVR